MADPVVFISHSRIREGKLEELREQFRRSIGLIESAKPRTVFFHAFMDEDGGAVEIVHVFPDAAAMDLHMEGAAERAKAAWELMAPRGFRIYGAPSEGTLSQLRSMAEAQGIDLHVAPAHVGGFARLMPGQG
jgi:hypothetical protein